MKPAVTKPLSTSDITKMAIEELSWRGFHVWRQNQIPVRGRRFTGQEGLSDIQGYSKKSGVAVYCEVKNVGDTLSEEQKDFLKGAWKAGCVTMIAMVDINGKFIIKNYMPLI